MTRANDQITNDTHTPGGINRKDPVHATVGISLLTTLVSWTFASCDVVGSKIQVTRAPSVSTTVTKISPIAARPNEVVSLTGRNFSEIKDLKVSLDLSNGERATVPLTVTDSQKASFAMPEGAGLGLKEATLTQGRTKLEVTKFNLIADQADNQLPIWIGEASEICNTREYIDRNGDTKTGTKDCSAGVTAPACSEDGGSNCLVDGSTYVAAKKENLAASKIKSGVTIAGVVGNYPSAASPLAGADGTADLSSDADTRENQLRSATNFEFFMSDGTRVVASGDSDISASNILSTATIFGITGNVTAAVAPDPWDVRVGKTINGVAGKLKVNCRNRVSATLYNYDGAISSIGTSPVNSGTVIDIWDTIDDYNGNVSGLPPSIVTAWDSTTDCGGVETVAGDDNVWKDVTTTSGGASSTCATDAERCTMQDKITGLWWSKLQANAAWDTAWSNCQSLNHNGQTGWRLPTQKELTEAYTHGIRSATSTNWIPQNAMRYPDFWSGSSASDETISAWALRLDNGWQSYPDKTSSGRVVCVR